MGYFQQTEYISNSDLGALKRAIWGGEELANLQEIFDFGNLVDAMATEEHKINGRFLTDQGRVIEFTEQKISKAQLMNAAIKADPVLFETFRRMRKQHEHYKTIKIEWDGWETWVKARCKTDGDIRSMRMGIDLKSTAAKSQVQAEAAFFHFDYDRQAAWYMDVADLDKMLYVFVGKEKGKDGRHPIFKMAVTRYSELYEKGKRKYSRWAFLYHYLIQTLDTSQLFINI